MDGDLIACAPSNLISAAELGIISSLEVNLCGQLYLAQLHATSLDPAPLLAFVFAGLCRSDRLDNAKTEASGHAARRRKDFC
jgi:hypothetical protein